MILDVQNVGNITTDNIYSDQYLHKYFSLIKWQFCCVSAALDLMIRWHHLSSMIPILDISNRCIEYPMNRRSPTYNGLV